MTRRVVGTRTPRGLPARGPRSAPSSDFVWRSQDSCKKQWKGTKLKCWRNSHFESYAVCLPLREHQRHFILIDLLPVWRILKLTPKWRFCFYDHAAHAVTVKRTLPIRHT